MAVSSLFIDCPQGPLNNRACLGKLGFSVSSLCSVLVVLGQPDPVLKDRIPGVRHTGHALTQSRCHPHTHPHTHLQAHRAFSGHPPPAAASRRGACPRASLWGPCPPDSGGREDAPVGRFWARPRPQIPTLPGNACVPEVAGTGPSLGWRLPPPVSSSDHAPWTEVGPTLSPQPRTPSSWSQKSATQASGGPTCPGHPLCPASLFVVTL